MAGVIAIVGRPNVGKSALFNRMVGRRIAIVHEEPGVTRDRITAEAEWCGRSFTLVDTGGLGLLRGEKASDVIQAAARRQVELAVEAASVLIQVVDIKEGLVPLDREVAAWLRASGKPVLLAANKADHPATEIATTEFAALGFEHLFPVSAIHDRGIEPLMNQAMALLDKAAGAASEPRLAAPLGPVPAADVTPSRPLRLAIVGRPNVGKSSLINALTRSERVIVTPIPGTTRDAVEVPFELETDGVRHQYILIDTAGLRKPRRLATATEFFSVKRAEHAIARCDIALLVLDAAEGITEQDKKVADKIVEAHKACIVVVNKWDVVADAVRQARPAALQGRPLKSGAGPAQRPATLRAFGQWVQERLFFLDYAPVIFVSAVSGFNLDRLMEAVCYVAGQFTQKIPTALLNRVLHDAVEQRQPPSAQGRRFHFFYATQIQQTPPTFLLFVNRKELLSEPYEKYLASRLRRAFGYEGCPIVLVAKSRPREPRGNPHRPGP